MNVKVWRISHRDYSSSVFTGEGAKLFGGRFNSEGLPAIYTCENLSLSLLEILVQVNDRRYFDSCLQYFIEIPEQLIFKPDQNSLPEGWDSIPYGSKSQKFGDEWLNRMDYVALKIPSVVVPMEFNYVINPAHHKFPDIKLSDGEKVRFDPRFLTIS